MGKHGFLADSSEKALNSYMRKVMNRGKSVLILNVGALNGNEASRFLEILKQWHKRVMLKTLAEKYGCIASKETSYDELCLVFQRYLGVV